MRIQSIKKKNAIITSVGLHLTYESSMNHTMVYRNILRVPSAGGCFLFAENDHPGCISKVGKHPGGIFRKAQHTHLTHTAAPTMSGLNTIYEKQLKRHKKDSSWGSLRPASVSCDDTSSDNKKGCCRFFCVSPGGGRFFAKKELPGVNSKVRRHLKKKKKKNGITQRFYAISAKCLGGEELRGYYGRR